MKDIHIGSLIKEKFEKKRKADKRFNKTVFAEQICVHRSTIYPIFEQKSIDIDLLARISEALDYNFIEEYLEKKGIKRNRLIVGIEITEEQFRCLNLSNELIILKEK